MHPALQVAEILLNIFSHWNPSYNDASGPIIRQSLRGADLAILARTCRLFKEPALDVLWSVLADLSPVARCLPHVCYQMYRNGRIYRFRRPLEQVEWSTLRSYTRRIRSVNDFDGTFCSYDVQEFLTPPITDPLFPNLRHLRYVYYGDEPSPLMYQPLPSLISVAYKFELDEDMIPFLFENYLGPFPGHSPKLGCLTVHMSDPEVAIHPIVCDFICRWPGPRIVSCPLVTLNMDAFKHLSSVSDLTQLRFMVDATLPDRITCLDVLCFSRLQELELYSEPLTPVSKLLARIRLPAITDLVVRFKNTPCKQDVGLFLEVLQTSGICNTITKLRVGQFGPIVTPLPAGSDYVLVADDLRPLMALKNLRHLDFNVAWSASLADSDLVELVSGWPHLEQLLINEAWGWRQTSGGITPDGIIRLLQMCRSLRGLALVVDARSLVGTPLRPPLGDFRLDPSRGLLIDVVDSAIEAASVPGMVAFITHLRYLMPSGTLRLTASMNPLDYSQRWQDVFAQAQKAVKESGRLWFDMWEK